MTTLDLTVELGQESVPGQRFASIKVGDITIFSEFVYDSPQRPAEKNILLLFGSRMRELLERD